MADVTIRFDDPGCLDSSVAGGKGANLARLTGAGLPVPPGFCITTEAYVQFIAQAGLDRRIETALNSLSGDVQALDAASTELRDAITETPLPDLLAQSIERSYLALGDGGFVAVRSSGTAEDLGDASFAGLHDTYLDIRGTAALLDAVKRCWASMWSTRAVSYRDTRGFDQRAARIAVVVQVMVESDVAGVMFTGNPLTAATDEIVINASVGLGEALVSGVATPDEHILDLATLRVKEQRIGAKEVRVIRDPDAGSGTIEQPTPAALATRFALTPTVLQNLARIGVRVLDHYGGIPQDIEWAVRDETIFVLQSRPITGVEFAWDADLEVWQQAPADDEILWSRSWADELWNGAISPLTYSYRGEMFTVAIGASARLWGMGDRVPSRMYRYDRATAYYNPEVERALVEFSAHPLFRPALLAHVPPDAHDAVLGAPFRWADWVRMHARIVRFGKPGNGPYKFFAMVDDYLENRVEEADGLSAEALRELSEEELIAYFERFVFLKTDFTRNLWTGFFIYARDAVSLCAGLVVTAFADPAEGQLVFSDLLSGLPERTATAEENFQLWRLSELLRSDEKLRGAFERADPANWLEEIERATAGTTFAAQYRRFATTHAHRGHADRDLRFPRRGDDPTIDHLTFSTLLASTAVSPEIREADVHRRRAAAIADVEKRLRRQSFGRLRILAFRRLLAYAHRFFLYRDNQRAYFDRFTYSMKRGAVEMGRRLHELGVLTDPDEIYMLGRHEIYQLLRGGARSALIDAKITARRRNYDRMLRHAVDLPKYLRRGRPVSFASTPTGDGLSGVGTSRGKVTARARIVNNLADIGVVKDGDVLVTHSTDPGWTPVFTLLQGIVLETGGMLAHGSCLAREYGFPAVQIADATKLIPDGALVTVNGDTGEVIIEDSIENEDIAVSSPPPREHDTATRGS
jgi:phosphohistidine swiveling domain-containing protein